LDIPSYVRYEAYIVKGTWTEL